jgi:hypothetical protein
MTAQFGERGGKEQVRQIEPAPFPPSIDPKTVCHSERQRGISISKALFKTGFQKLSSNFLHLRYVKIIVLPDLYCIGCSFGCRHYTRITVKE